MTASAGIEAAMEEPAFPVRCGVFVAVVGPSGAGKDTLIDHARARLGAGDDVVFVRRIITRQADPAAEDHDTLDADAFEAARRDGRFAVDWQANGLSYALPADIDGVVRAGRVAVANVSRAAVPALRRRYRNVLVVLVTAPAEVLADRLARRGRESRAAVLERLERGRAPALAVDGATVIDNSGAPEEAGRRFLAALRRAVAWSALSDQV